MRNLLLSTLVAIFIGCGYKPTSLYTQTILGDRVFADVKVDLKEPESTILIKDALNEAIVSRFNSVVSNSDFATSKLLFQIYDLNFIPLQYNREGYVVRYRTDIILDVDYLLSNSEEFKSMRVSGMYEFNIEPTTVISDLKRFEAIKHSSFKALDEFIFRLSHIGVESEVK